MTAVDWDQDDWEIWSNDLADALPQRYDGDDSQESIILNAVKDMAARDARLHDYAVLLRNISDENPRLLGSDARALHEIADDLAGDTDA